MPVYMISVTCAAAISGIILSLIFYRLKVFNFRTAAAITMASLVTSLAMPGIISLICSSGNNSQDSSAQAILALVSILVYLILVLILSAAIAFLLPKIKTRSRTAALAGTMAAQADTAASILPGPDRAEAAQEGLLQELAQQAGGTVPQAAEAESTGSVILSEAESTGSVILSEAESTRSVILSEAESTGSAILSEAENTGSVIPSEPVPEADTLFAPNNETDYFDKYIMDGDFNVKTGDNYIEDIYLKFVGRNDENSESMEDNEVNEGFEVDSVEKSVDSDEIIDKMGIENNIQDSGNMTIEECINEAYRLREAGDSEGSILYYMYALDKKPQKELTFWIILDICVLYKSLGQQDLALDILNGYYDIYGDEMDSSVKEEIIRNLTDMGA